MGLKYPLRSWWRAIENKYDAGLRRQDGKSIARVLEGRFDTVLEGIAAYDPKSVQSQAHARWLLDNSHLVRQTLQQIETDLPINYYRQLQRTGSSHRRAVPRIFALINQCIDQSGLPIDCRAIERKCRNYSSNTDSTPRLTLGELWAVPIALRVSLLGRLCDVSEQAAKRIDDIELQADGDDGASAVASCIASLRTVATFDWREFVERSNSVDPLLKQDPTGFYHRMDFATRDLYRSSIEKIARRTIKEQWEVAEVALGLATSAQTENLPARQQHIGYYLVDKGRQQLIAAIDYRQPIDESLKYWATLHAAGLYLTGILALAAGGSFALWSALVSVQVSVMTGLIAALVALIPLLFVSSGTINFIVSMVISPRLLPKLDFSRGIPNEHKTIVVVPMLLSSAEETEQNLRSLEHNYLGNSDPQLRYALLSDFVDAEQPETPFDQALLDQAIAGIDQLNDRYASQNAGRFLLLHRRRLWNERAQRWMGWERKRGKLEELNSLLRGAEDTSFVLQSGGTLTDSSDIRYVITLDADSYMPTGTAVQLVGAMAHPLNRARFDDDTNCVVDGYTVIQPRLETNPVSGADTVFAKIFAGDVLLDLYTHAVSDVYQDLFGDAVFAGKGIYDIDSFQRSIAKQVPTNTVLSHDLLEGLYGRVGLASDTVLLENYPLNYLSYLRRLHRWIRGDWQLLPWLNPWGRYRKDHFAPGIVGYWKIVDNLRRSLFSLAILLLLIIAWVSLPTNVFGWTLLIGLFPGLPILLRVTLALKTSLWRWGTIKSSLHNLLSHAGADASRWLLALAFLPAEAIIVADAVLRTLFRILVSRRKLLEWMTAAQVSRSISRKSTIVSHYRELWIGPAVAAGTAIAIAVFNNHAILASMPFLALWFFSPAIAYWLGKPDRGHPDAELGEFDTEFCRGIARDTWRFFERFVGPDSNWLPPDNVQEYPKRTIAERTSPTNIGMMLLSTLSAYDLGYLGYRQLISRLTDTTNTIYRMRKHRGHLYNWYSTRDLQPLQPLYVSTVDSGNFVAALIAVYQMLNEPPAHTRIVEQTFNGLADEVAAIRRQLLASDSSKTHSATDVLNKKLDAAQAVLTKRENFLGVLHELDGSVCGEIEHAFLDVLNRHPHHWSTEQIANFRENSQVFRQRIRLILADVEMFAPWTRHGLTPPAVLHDEELQKRFKDIVDALSTWPETVGKEFHLVKAAECISALIHELDTKFADSPMEDVRQWLTALQTDVENARSEAARLDRSRNRLSQIVAALIERTDFRFLYDTRRHLFRVGYNASLGQADDSYYDLLASESRIASFVAISLGQIPAKHWMHLGRPLTRIRGLRILLSWSATAFEYLMPRLIMHNPSMGLLSQSCAGAVNQQIRFGRDHDIPWGVSESGYAQFDPHNHYQYYAFGIPMLGLKWDQGERLVVSSYASVLALPFAAEEAVRNLRRLASLGASGHYGLFEALDFGDAHKRRSERPRIVQSYMAHHQGMILVAINNLLNQDPILRRFHRDPRIASVEHLLFERLPQRIQTRPLERLPTPLKELPLTPATVTQWPVRAVNPELAVLSNDRLSSHVSAEGGGALYWRGLAVTRWDPLAQGPSGGTCLYIKCDDDDEVRRLGADRLGEESEVHFAPHNAEFRLHRPDLLARMSITVAPHDDVEIRKLSITNDGSEIQHVTLSSYSEPVLAPENADRRHYTFSKLFIESQWLEDEQTLLFRRRPRETDEPTFYFAHSIVGSGRSNAVQYPVFDRQSFFGRNGDARNPPAIRNADSACGDTVRTTLDPCVAIALKMEIPPRSTIHCAFLSSVGGTRDAALNAMAQFRTMQRIDWVVEASRMRSENELSTTHTTAETVRNAFQLLHQVRWPRTMNHIGDNSFDAVREAQDSLWRHGISGDRPVVTVRIYDEKDLPGSEDLLHQISYLSRRGVSIDIVFLDESKGGYAVPINDRLRQLVGSQLPPGRERNGSSAFIVPARSLSPEEKTDLIVTARVFIDSHKHPLSFDVATLLPTRMPAFVPQPSAPLSHEPTTAVKAHNTLQLETGIGGMLPDHSGYSMLISKDSRTPAPWCNVLANRKFGCLVSESGSMCTWWGNSSERRITPWNNDPVLDQTGEAVYVRDEETGESWSLTPQPKPNSNAYRVTHSIGETLFEHNSHGLEQQLSVFVDSEESIKFLRVRLANKWQRSRRLTVTFAAEWVLGNGHTHARHLLLPERDGETGALLVRNGFDRHSTEAIAFVTSDRTAHGVTCDGNEFFGRRRSWATPAALAAVGLSDRVAPNDQPCGIYQVHIDLSVDAVEEFHFALGAAPDRASADRLIGKSINADWVAERRDKLTRHWSSLLGVWRVTTPDAAHDAMINKWLLYQVTSSRLWGRIGFYQASGGYGFRDQLQDSLALLDSQAELVRDQILLAASRQFEEGDVLHWWHEAPLRGVRTRCADDLLWLPYAVAEFINVTDDRSILEDATAFLHGEQLGEHETERYAEFHAGPNVASIYEHCLRAIDERISFGAHGLPFIGSGDWNDGLNRVGEKGRGESVWMAWFLIVVCREFAPLCHHMGDEERANHYESVANELLQRTEQSAFSGEWFLRGYFDDGTPLGAMGDCESEIDLNAQTWAVLAGASSRKTAHAMQAVKDKLIDAENRLIKLLSPPFEKSIRDPGYIRSYPPGVRENGGQYTHAAVWAAWAANEMGDKEGAFRWFDWLNPLKRARSEAEIDQYRLEPYATAGDIYSVGDLAGRGGWSWYTGSAAWLYRLAIRKLMGLQRCGNRMFIRPRLPDSWPWFQASLNYQNAYHSFRIHEPDKFEEGPLYIIKNNSSLETDAITLEDSGEYRYEVFPSDQARSKWLLRNESRIA